MFSVAAMSYREMALVSLGFCCGQMGDGMRARTYYEQALRSRAKPNCAFRASA
jgi:hypothetical protein